MPPRKTKTEIAAAAAAAQQDAETNMVLGNKVYLDDEKSDNSQENRWFNIKYNY